MNHMIRISPIRLIGPENEQIGVIETHQALRMAEEAGLDLVEVVPDGRPPVCKIMDYGKYKYELSKKKQPSTKGNELKEIRLGRSIKIDKHDLEIRTHQARRFLMDGHKVQVIQRFKGREFAHKDLGLANMREFYEALEDICKVEQPPRPFGRQFTMLLAPDKARVESARRKLEREAAAEHAEAQAKLDAEIAALDARQAQEADDDDDELTPEEIAEQEALEKVEKTRKGKQRDKRAVNPVDDEIAELLGD
ncbi:MAG: translation initiation factor IF-3 [Phycisphaerales bacterium]|nr:translation initiation factor IF-3 [Phycisphaerales bacterium]